jgi:predicted SpoU family rRNA methylase
MLNTTIMWDGNEKIVGTTAVKERLRKRLLDEAKKLGGKNLETGMFIKAFRTRGPSYGDVIRQVIRELTKLGLMKMKNVGTEKNPRWVYDVA